MFTYNWPYGSVMLPQQPHFNNAYGLTALQCCTGSVQLQAQRLNEYFVQGVWRWSKRCIIKLTCNSKHK